MRRYLVYWFSVACHYGGLDALVRRLRRPALCILMLHRLRDEQDPLPLSLTPATYRWLIRCLSKRGWLRSLDDGLAGLDNGRAGIGYTLTLDDGYADNLVVLESASEVAPLTIYVSTSLVGGQTFWAYQLVNALAATEVQSLDLSHMGYGVWALDTEPQRRDCLTFLNRVLKTLHVDELEARVADIVRRLGVDTADASDRMLTWDEVKTLRESGVEIGAHTQRHGILTRLSPEEARHEIVESGRDLQRELGAPPRHFSYPNGGRDDYNADIKEMVRAAGYASAVTTVEGVNRADSDRFELLRINITEDRCRSPGGQLSEAYFLSYTTGAIAALREMFGG